MHIEFHHRYAISVNVKDHTQLINAKNLEMQIKDEKKNSLLLESLSATVSHELRTPIATSVQFLEICYDMIKK